MHKIDVHHHLWNYHKETHGWIDESMEVLKRDFTPEDLKRELDRVQFEGCVAVQASQTESETEFLLGQAEKYSFIKGVVGWVDLCSPSIQDQLKHFSKFGKLKGFRHVVQDEPDDRFLLRKDFLHGISQLKEYGFTYDLLIFPRQLEAAIEFVGLFPDQPFVLDHIAKPEIRNGRMADWRSGIESLGRHKNLYCKLSGIVTEADWWTWRYEELLPYLDVVFGTFGEDRLMVGSDWPVCKLAAEYDEVMGIVLKYLEGKDQEVHKKILGQNAIDFYHLKP
jgi:L-fuconolactonase